MKNTWLITTFSLLLLTGSAFGQNDNYLKIDLVRILRNQIPLSFETRNEKSGFEIQLAYDYDQASLTEFLPFDPSSTLPQFQNFSFDQSQFHVVFSYKKYFGIFKKPGIGYVGLVNENTIFFSRDEDYNTKFEEIFGQQAESPKTLRHASLGITTGVSIPIKEKFRIEIGIQIGLDFITTEFGESYYLPGNLPIQISYKF